VMILIGRRNVRKRLETPTMTQWANLICV
jgi:hypothetical protein